jgi:epoxyqueuosine reductase QueG
MVCPWYVKFTRERRDGSPFAPRAFIAGKGAATLARDLLALDEEGFRAAFSKSPMKRATLAGLQRNARVVLARSRTMDSGVFPTILREGPYRLFFCSREEPRMHVHVAHPDGEAKS